MKRIAVFVFAMALAVPVFAATPHESHKATEAKMQTITGELVDTGCYLGHGARGAKHIECATKCVSNGMPMGILTSSDVLYLVTMSHDNADPYNNLKEALGKTVSVTGPVMTRGGMKGIEATAFKVAEPASK